MSPEELREKVARAICAAAGQDPDEILPCYSLMEPRQPHEAWKDAIPEADAALRVVREAMREPSEEMRWAGNERDEDARKNEQMVAATVEDVWRAMFAASPLREPGA